MRACVHPSTDPRIDVCLTLSDHAPSTHAPFAYPTHSIHRSFQGDWRLNTKWSNYSPVMGQVVQNQVLFMNPPSFTYKTEVTYNTSSASSTHFLRYIDQICSGLDFEFAFKVHTAHNNE